MSALFLGEAEMSRIQPCNKCGQRISLRKMRPGNWVAFDVRTNNPHKCSKGSKTDSSIKKVPTKFFGKKLKEWMDQKRTSLEIAEALKKRGVSPTIFRKSVNNFVDKKKIKKAKEILSLLEKVKRPITTIEQRTEEKDWAGEITDWGEWYKEENSDNTQMSKSRLLTIKRLVILAILIAVIKIIFG